jgi:hypothetical protein
MLSRFIENGNFSAQIVQVRNLHYKEKHTAQEGHN